MSFYETDIDRCPACRPSSGWYRLNRTWQCVRGVHASGRHRDAKGRSWVDPWDVDMADEEDVLDALLPRRRPD